MNGSGENFYIYISGNRLLYPSIWQIEGMARKQFRFCMARQSNNMVCKINFQLPLNKLPTGTCLCFCTATFLLFLL